MEFINELINGKVEHSFYEKGDVPCDESIKTEITQSIKTVIYVWDNQLKRHVKRLVNKGI